MAAKELIQTITVGSGGAAAIEFTSIPQNATDLLVVLSARYTEAQGSAMSIRFNGSTSGYSFKELWGSGSTTTSRTSSTEARPGWPAGSDNTASTFGSAQIYIPNYASATNKSVSADSVTENNATAAYQAIIASSWANTAAITSLSIFPNAGAFVQYSTASLYMYTKGSGGATVS